MIPQLQNYLQPNAIWMNWNILLHQYHYCLIDVICSKKIKRKFYTLATSLSSVICWKKSFWVCQNFQISSFHNFGTQERFFTSISLFCLLFYLMSVVLTFCSKNNMVSHLKFFLWVWNWILHLLVYHWKIVAIDN